MNASLGPPPPFDRELAAGLAALGDAAPAPLTPQPLLDLRREATTFTPPTDEELSSHEYHRWRRSGGG